MYEQRNSDCLLAESVTRVYYRFVRIVISTDLPVRYLFPNQAYLITSGWDKGKKQIATLFMYILGN